MPSCRPWKNCPTTRSTRAAFLKCSTGRTPSRGVFYRPVKRQITLRLDADLIAWFKARAQGGRGYQTDINRALRQHVERCEKERTA